MDDKTAMDEQKIRKILIDQKVKASDWKAMPWNI